MTQDDLKPKDCITNLQFVFLTSKKSDFIVNYLIDS